MHTEIKWIPGHKDIKANKEADKAMKQAVKLKGEDATIPKSTHKPLKSVRSVLIQQTITHEWNMSWKSQMHDAQTTMLHHLKALPSCYFRASKGVQGSCTPLVLLELEVSSLRLLKQKRKYLSDSYQESLQTQKGGMIL